MTDYTAGAAYDINAWLWSELKSTGILSGTAYHSNEIGANLTPIIPVGQRAEFNDQFGGQPFIVYDYIIDYAEPDFWMVNCEQILYTVYTDDYSKANQIKSLMVDLFRRYDESAKDLNRFNMAAGNSTLAYLDISVLNSSKTGPVEEAGGRYASDMVIEVKYLRGITSSASSIGRYA